MSARSLKVELRNTLPRDFNPGEIDRRLLRGEDQITLLGIGLFDPESELVKQADAVILAIQELLFSRHETKSIGVDYVSKATKLPDVDAAHILKELSHIGIFHDSGTNYGHGVDGWLTINVDERTFDAYLKFENIDQILDTLVEGHATKSIESLDQETSQKALGHSGTDTRLEPLRSLLSELASIDNSRRQDDYTKTVQKFERWKERAILFIEENFGAREAEKLSPHQLPGTQPMIARQRHNETLRIFRECRSFIEVLIEEVEGQSHMNEGSRPSDKLTVQNTHNVFVVHGRNLEARDSLFRFLRSIGLKPLEWSQAIKETGKASPFIGEILDVAFSRAQAIIVLMTPDDEARLREAFRGAVEPSYETELTGQARPNVLFEAGIAMGRNPDRTIIVELGTLRPFSDIGGRHTIRLSNDPAARHELAQRLETAGCPVDLTGKDWLTDGDFKLQEKVLNPQAATDDRQRNAAASREPASETTRSISSTAPSREIAEAWRDGVINPLLTAMTHEQQLLESGVLPWERYGKHIRGLVYAGGRATYSGLEEEFYEIHADIKKEIDNHNALVAELTTRKEALFLAVAESSYLLNAYKDVTSPSALQDLREKYRHEIGRYEADDALLQGMFGSPAGERDEHLKILAMHVVNNAGDLPSNYTTHAMWNTHKGRFLEVLSYPPVSAEKLLVDQALERLSGCVESLINQLKKVRKEICRHHGIPVEEPSRSVSGTSKWL